MTTPETIDSSNYFYANQIKKYIIQFMEVFAQFKVKTGKNNFNTSGYIHVPIKHGSMDRVVGHIKTSHTQNKAMSLPIMAANLLAIEQSPESRKGIGQDTRSVHLQQGGSIPNDLNVVYKTMPIPYRLRMELSIFSSNADQQLQILEQILMLFDPMLQIYTSDDQMDWTKINTIELENINLEESYPAENMPRVIVSSLIFSVICWLSPPANIKQNFIKSIRLRLATIPTFENTAEIAKDVDRLDPEYQVLFDIDDYDIPAN